MTLHFSGRIETAYYTVTVAASGTTSGHIRKPFSAIVGLVTPSALTSVQVSFEGSLDGTTFMPLYNASGELLEATVGTSRCVSFSWDDFMAVDYFRIVTGSTEAAERSFQIVTRTFV